MGYCLCSYLFRWLRDKEDKTFQWSFAWEVVMEIWPSILPHILYDTGDGSKVKFWQDRWYGETSLTVSYPNLFKFCWNKEASVAELMKSSNGVLF